MCLPPSKAGNSKAGIAAEYQEPFALIDLWLVRAIGYRFRPSFGMVVVDGISGSGPFETAFGLARSGKDRMTKASSDGWVGWKGWRVFERTT
jgi:hypothetical protein